MIEKLSKDKIDVLKKELEELSEEEIANYKKAIEDFLPPNIVSKAKDPQNL